MSLISLYILNSQVFLLLTPFSCFTMTFFQYELAMCLPMQVTLLGQWTELFPIVLAITYKNSAFDRFY
ncbi:hypothetical protein BDQ12DRAFT_693439 [Crucibulum laeve]|uniref:Uncharacterized protein n=1 Tax=Crucibulum laeve TaxID=68775 RepID=A0A5C3LSS1_9AGAR|nr:hypothetical protein BDQ12DRAFT_693439 [Crucibulum laeve]